ncbi:hypothetical protein CHH27_01380 [Labrenzia sp. VG12]|nr:hypothetical protein CHH27_01380 [Labrenzia sp. VG12]
MAKVTPDLLEFWPEADVPLSIATLQVEERSRLVRAIGEVAKMLNAHKLDAAPILTHEEIISEISSWRLSLKANETGSNLRPLSS